MKNNKKGAALMQVLLIAIVLAGIATMLLRVTLSRTSSARQTRRSSSAEVLVQSCMAEVNGLWSRKTPEAFRRDITGEGNSGKPYMYCKTVNSTTGACTSTAATYTCTYNTTEGTYKVTAEFVLKDGIYNLQYKIDKDSTSVL